ncbi:MAG: hypothetical protein KDC52_06955 [Ignavibacteriae bacterium]|nr:hypothetical protein [Ignavibacteriota bacterium]MCB0751194.1 hypothetical protein [Ignavibacteriota bacterium]MCB9247939.1 hypothetical protein [Ignavibacteriales bacterium]
MKKLQFFFIALIFISTTFAQTEQLLSLKSNLNVELEAKNNLLANPSFEKKSPGMAILYSFLLPGMGELYAGNYSSGQYFTIADGVIWGFFTGFTIYGNDKRNDYRNFAKAYASVDLSGKDDQYFADISAYENIEEFNREKELNRDFNEVYDLTNDNWSWESPVQRKEYRALWSSSETAVNNVRFAVGALILNRIVSSIFAVKAVSAYNKRQSSEVSWNVNFGLNPNPNLPPTLVMNFSQRF